MINLYGHVHNCSKNPAQQKRFDLLGKMAVNIGVDVNGFLPVSIEAIVGRVG